MFWRVSGRIMDEIAKWLPWSQTTTVTMLARTYDATEEGKAAFIEDFSSRIRLTYRDGLDPPLKLKDGRTLGSDTGWGCMLRAIQMMMAQCFLTYALGRDWRFDASRDLAQGSEYLQVIQCFLDVPNALLSLHQLVTAGQALLGKEVSTWFGPTSSARVAAHLMDRAVATPPLLSKLACVVFEDAAIYKSQVLERFAAGADCVIILVCFRLGLDEFNVEIHRPGLQATFGLTEFQGLASGNSNSSAHFFVASHGDSLLFLDPHITQPALRSLEAVVELQDLHPDRPFQLHWSRLNPSLCAAFMVNSTEAFSKLCQKLTEAPFSETFEVLDKAPVYSTADQCIDEDGDMMLVG